MLVILVFYLISEKKITASESCADRALPGPMTIANCSREAAALLLITNKYAEKSFFWANPQHVVLFRRWQAPHLVFGKKQGAANPPLKAAA